MFLSYIVNNFALLCTAVAMIFIIIYNARGQKRENFYSFLIIGTALLLSVFSAIEQWGKTQVDHPLIATIFAGLGYIIRPICVYFFIEYLCKQCGLNEHLLPYFLVQMTCLGLVAWVTHRYYVKPLARKLSQPLVKK